jgi:hypothetical protein
MTSCALSSNILDVGASVIETFVPWRFYSAHRKSMRQCTLLGDLSSVQGSVDFDRELPGSLGVVGVQEFEDIGMDPEGLGLVL